MPMNRAGEHVDVPRYQAVAMLTDALSNLLHRTSGLVHGQRTTMMADDAISLTVASLTDEIQLLLPRTPEQMGVSPVPAQDANLTPLQAGNS